MWRFWIVLVLVACLSLGVMPRPTVVMDDDFDGSGTVFVDDERSFFTDDVWYGASEPPTRPMRRGAFEVNTDDFLGDGNIDAVVGCDVVSGPAMSLDRASAPVYVLSNGSNVQITIWGPDGWPVWSVVVQSV